MTRSLYCALFLLLAGTAAHAQFRAIRETNFKKVYVDSTLWVNYLQNASTHYAMVAYDSTDKKFKSVSPSLFAGGILSATSPILYNSTTGNFSLDTAIDHSYSFYNTKYQPIGNYLTPPDTTGRWLTNLYRKAGSDSVFYTKGGLAVFAYKDSAGAGGGGGAVYGGITGTLTNQTDLYDTLLNRPLVFNVKNYGAYGDGRYYYGGVSISSGSATLVAATAIFSASDVGKKVVVYGAGAAGGNFISTISSFTNGTTVTLANTAATTAGNVKPMLWGHDDATAIQTALNSTKRDSAYNGTVYFPYTGGAYLIGSAIDATDSAQLSLPFTAYTSISTMGHIVMKGEVPPNMFTDFELNNNAVPTHMITLLSINDAARGYILGSNIHNYTQLSLENLTFRVRSKAANTDIAPTMGAIDASTIEMLSVENCRIDNESNQYNSVQPTSTCNIGLKTPAVNNWAWTMLKNILIQNYYTGITGNESINADGLWIGTCYTAVDFQAAFHTANFSRLLTAWNVRNIVISGTCDFSIANWEIEDYPGGAYPSRWFDNVYDIYEPSNTSSKASITYWRVQSGVGGAQTLTTSYTSTAIQANAIGVPLVDIAKATSGNNDYYTFTNTSTNRYPSLVLNSTNANANPGILFQRSGVTQFSLAGDPAGTLTHEMAWYDNTGNKAIAYYNAAGDLSLVHSSLLTSPAVTIKAAGSLIANSKLGVGSNVGTPTYPLEVQSNLNNVQAYFKSAGTSTRVYVDNGSSNSGLTLVAAGTPKFSVAYYSSKFSIFNETAVNDGFTLDGSNNGMIRGTLSVNKGSNAVASAALEVSSTSQGFLKPVLTTTQQNAISTPATGLEIYNSTGKAPAFYDGTAWKYGVLTAFPTDGQIPIGSTSTGQYTAANITAGSRIAVTNGAGSIAIAVTGGYGQATLSGNGSSTSFTIAHGLAGISGTSKVFLTARSTASAGWAYIDLNATNINIFYTAAPASGTNNLLFDWQIIP
jgi:hypothetical protein